MPERGAEPRVVVPAGAEFEGTLVLPLPARIDGSVRGRVLAESDVWVGETGFVGADLAGERIVVAGSVQGDVYARTSIELHPTGRVLGNLTAPSLRLADGAVVDGECRSGRRAPSPPVDATEEAPRRSPAARPTGDGRGAPERG